LTKREVSQRFTCGKFMARTVWLSRHRRRPTPKRMWPGPPKRVWHLPSWRPIACPFWCATPTVKWVAGAHAGWRGLAGQEGHGVVETLAQAARAQGLSPQDCVVWLGPCIGPSAFEVGEDVFAAFGSLIEKSDKPANLCVQTSSTKYLANLAGLARERLKLAGFGTVHGNDSSLPWCTYRQEALYHSHRRDAVAKGGSGRMAAYIWITA